MSTISATMLGQIKEEIEREKEDDREVQDRGHCEDNNR